MSDSRTELPIKEFDPLNYANLQLIENRCINVTDNNYSAFRSKRFIKFSDDNDQFMSESPMLFARAESEYGWKLHLSVAKDKLIEAWPVIVAVLMNYRVTSFKVTNPEYALNPAYGKFSAVIGKQVTIYMHHNKNLKPDDWLIIMQKIENALNERGIQPGVKPVANQAIAGSAFFTYRNDAWLVAGTHRKKYIRDTDAEFIAQENPAIKAYNPSDLPGDPFATSALTLENLSFVNKATG